MLDAGEMLWHVNNEYRKRLAAAQNGISLLIQLLESHSVTPTLLSGLHYAVEELDTLTEELRGWRREFYYQPDDSKRMVQTDRDIHRALSNFHRMRTRHEQRLADLWAVLGEVVRPDSRYTRIPSGDDLWERAENALADLSSFGQYLENLSA